MTPNTFRLMQAVDRPLSSLAETIASRESGVTDGLFEAWKKDMVTVVEEGVGGLMDLSVSLEKMVSCEVQVS